MVDCPSAFPAFVFVEFGGEVALAGRAEGNGEEQGGVIERRRKMKGWGGRGGRKGGRKTGMGLL